MFGQHRNQIVATAFAIVLSLGSTGLTHAATDPTLTLGRTGPVIASPTQPDPDTLIVRTDLQATFLSRGTNGATTVDLYQIKNAGPVTAQNAALEKLCSFRSQSTGATVNQYSTVQLGSLAAGATTAPSVTCTAAPGMTLHHTSARVSSSTPDTNTGNNVASSN